MLCLIIHLYVNAISRNKLILKLTDISILGIYHCRNYIFEVNNSFSAFGG